MRLGFLLAIALAATGTAQTIESPRPPVRLDVVVASERGERLDALRPADFKVSIGGKPVELTSVRFVKPPAVPVVAVDTAASADADEEARLFGIVLDEYHVTPGPAAERVRSALIRFVREDLRPGDQLAVLKPLDSVVSVSLTTDRDAVAAAIERFTPRRGDYRPTTPLERELIAGAPPRIDAARAQIVTSLVNAMATHLGRSAAGRKTVILVSEGFSPALAKRRDGLFPGVNSIVAAANRSRVAVYPLSPGDAAGVADTSDPAREMLRTLAASTTGRFAEASAEPRMVLQNALADASGYYVLTFPADAERDGRFHDVDVAVAQPRATVRARRGFWSASAMEQRARSPISPFLSPYSSRISRRTSMMIRPWFGMAPGDDGATRVNFVWEPAPRVPGERSILGTPARVVLSVTTLDGDPVFDGAVAPATSTFNLPGTPSRVVFPTSATRLLVQMAIEDAGARVIDRDVRDLLVGSFAGDLALGTAEVLRARNARERRAIDREPLATPVSSRTFSRSEQLIVRVPVYSGGDAPALTGRLVSGPGGVMRQVTGVPMPQRPGVYQFELSLASFATGAYRFEIFARGTSGEARDSVPLRVTP